MKTLYDGTEVSDDTPTVIDTSVGGRRLMTQQEISDRESDEITSTRTHHLKAVKEEAGRRILAIAPDWKQRNYIARSLDFLRKRENNLTQSELEELNVMDQFWSLVKSIRLTSNQLESSIESMTGEQLKAFNPADDANWP